MEIKDIYFKYVEKPLAVAVIAGAMYFAAVGTEYCKSYSRDANGNSVPIATANKTFMKDVKSSAKTVNKELADIVMHPWKAFVYD
jgi:hypothetical protein